MVCANSLYLILWDSAYYHLWAIGVFMLMWEFRATTKRGSLKYVAVEIGFWYSVNNVLDELFFNPKAINFNEYIFAAIIVYVTIQNHRAHGRNTTR